MDFTEITKKTGSIIAKIKNNNKLVEELNKKFNPTFVEIIENLQKTDKTLCQLLMVWYMNTYSIDEDELNNIVEKYKDKTIKKQTKPKYVLESGCGNTSGWLYNGGCSGGYGTIHIDSGCGGSSSSRGGC